MNMFIFLFENSTLCCFHLYIDVFLFFFVFFCQGLIPNGDGSTGVVLARKIKKEQAAAAAADE